ncbi:hypothetical protein ACWC24_32880 [Streptomyces sp. NPDC001443]
MPPRPAGEYCTSRIPTLHQCSHTTAEGLTAGSTGALASPAALLLARYEAVGHLRLTARSTPLATAARRELAERLHPADPDPPGTVAASPPGGAHAVTWTTTPYGPTW